MTYRIELRLPEVQSTFELRDLLPSLTGVPPSEGSMELISSRIVSIGSNLTFTPSGPAEGDAGAVITGGVAWNLGQIRNTADNIRDGKDVIVFEVVARVPNIPANQPGDGLINLARVDYGLASGGTAFVSDTETITIVGPELVATKTPSAATGDAGDVITYTISIAPDALASTADAYGVVVTDALHPLLRLNAGSVTATLGGLDIGTIVTGNKAGDSSIRFTLDRLPDATAVPLLITYRATLLDTVRAGDTIPNTVDIAWRSAPDNGAFPEARGDATSASASVGVAINDSFTKNVIATTLDETTGDDVALGERVTYELVATLGEGTQSLLIQDALPPGMAIVSASVFSIGAGISGSLLNVGDAGLITGNSVRFDFGNNVVNDGTNGAGSEQIVMRVVGRVVADPAVNPDGRILTNAATLTSDTASTPLTASDSVRVVAPNVLIDKSGNVTAGHAGDIVTYTVVVRQQAGATGPLYDLVVTDPLPARMALVQGSVTTDRGTVILGDDAGETSVEVRLAGAALLAADNPATPGVDESRVTVTYRARILDSAEPGETITNRADFTGSTAPASIVTDPTERRSVSGSDNAVVAVDMPIDLAKTIFDTALPDTDPGVAVGETVTYRLTATVTPGTQTLVISDTLPPGMTFESARVVSVAGGLPLDMLAVLPTTPAVGSTGAVTFDFGTIVNPGADTAVDSVTVEIVTRVADVPGNVNGTNLLNAASATVASPTNPGAPGGTLTDTAHVPVTVVAPVLVIDKSAPPAFLAPGETVVYTLELRHAGTSTSPAYDVVVNDPLADPYLELVPGTVTALVNGVAAGTIVTAGGTLRVELPILRLGEVLTIAFTGRALATMPVAETLTNTVTASYDSANDGLPGTEGRPGSTTDTQNLPGQPGLDKEIVATSLLETGASFFDPARVDLAIGEVVTYRLTITLPQGLTEDLVLTDKMPGGLQPLAGRVVGVGAGFPPGLYGVAAAIDPATGRVTFDFGDVTNTSLAAVGAEDRIVVEIDARVRDAGGPAAGDTLTNMAKADFTIGGRAGALTDAVTVDVVEPALTIDKAVIGATTGDAGDIITYTVTIAHASASSGPAYDLVVTDPLPASLVPLSVTSSRGSASFVPGGVQLLLGTAAFLPTEGPITLTYTARLADTVEPGQVIPNTATLNFDSAKGDGGRAGTASDTAEVKAVFTADLQKTVTGTSLPKTGSSSFNPDRPDVAIGETVFYQLQATISEGTQRLVITDNVPEGMRILSGNLVTRGSGITAAAPVITISADERSITFDFGTVVNAGSTSPLDASDRITLAVSTLVIDGPLQVAGRELTNNAQVVISSPTEPGRPGGTVTDDASATVDLVTSVLALDKSASPPGVDAGDEVTYTLTLRHPGESTGPAYNVLVSDVLSAAVTYIPGSLRVVSGPGVATFVGTDRIEVLAEVLLLTDVVTIEYRARVTDAIEPGQVIPNTADVAFASAPNVEGRPGNDDASASVLGQFQVALDKQIIATSLPQTGNGFFDPAAADLAIGETATYRLTVTLSEGTQRLVLTDSLPAGMVIESASVAGLGAGISAFSLTSLTFSGTSFRLEALVVNTGNNLLGDGTILVDVVARVADVAANVAGRPLVNMAEATVSSPTSPGAPGGTLSATDTAPADVATPVLVFDKAVGEPFAGLGEPVTYTLTLTHAGNSTAPAFNVVLQDLLADQNLALVPGSVVTSLGVVVLGNGGADGVVRVELAELALGQTLTVTFRAVAT
ncbi:MAG: isopeptide-forming domain-containing fimbrial protein, partial [Roseomonas sp.]|nr:isopeptide-forming domain-containing fimbrial protein [Roseomonas sp.]